MRSKYARNPILTCADVQRMHPEVEHCGSCWDEQEGGYVDFGPEDWPPSKDGLGPFASGLDHPCAQTCCGCTKLVAEWTRDQWAQALRLRRAAARKN